MNCLSGDPTLTLVVNTYIQYIRKIEKGLWDRSTAENCFHFFFSFSVCLVRFFIEHNRRYAWGGRGMFYWLFSKKKRKHDAWHYFIKKEFIGIFRLSHPRCTDGRWGFNFLHFWKHRFSTLLLLPPLLTRYEKWILLVSTTSSPNVCLGSKFSTGF